MPVQSA